MYNNEEYNEEHQARIDAGFRNPGGHSALRKGARNHACPTCGRPNMLSDADVRHGYQCDICADAAEGGGY